MGYSWEKHDPDRLTRLLLRIMDKRQAVPLKEFCARTGVDILTVCALMESLVAKGEVECLRPVGYDRFDRDYFRKVRPAVARRT